MRQFVKHGLGAVARVIPARAKTALEARDQSAETRSQIQLPTCRDRARAAHAAKSGGFASRQEISATVRLPGGGRSRDRTCLSSQIPCYPRVCREFIAICREFGIETYRKTPDRSALRPKFPTQRSREFFAAGQGIWSTELVQPGNFAGFVGPSRRDGRRSRWSSDRQVCQQDAARRHQLPHPCKPVS